MAMEWIRLNTDDLYDLIRYTKQLEKANQSLEAQLSDERKLRGVIEEDLEKVREEVLKNDKEIVKIREELSQIEDKTSNVMEQKDRAYLTLNTRYEELRKDWVKLYDAHKKCSPPKKEHTKKKKKKRDAKENNPHR